MAKLREIAGSREILLNLILRDLRGRYRRSALGWAWSLVNPLATMLIFTMVFRVFLKVQVPAGDPSGETSFALFLLTSLLFWTFFSSSLTASMGTMLANASLIQKVYFPREILVLAAVGSALVTLLIELGVLSVALLAAGNFVLPWLPLVLLLVLVQAGLTVGIALVLSIVNVYFRDIEYVVGILLQLLFYAAPIVYPASAVPPKVGIWGMEIPMGDIYNVNPLVRFIQAYRDCLYDLRFPPLADTLYLVAVSAIVLAVGFLIFARMEGRLAEEL